MEDRLWCCWWVCDPTSKSTKAVWEPLVDFGLAHILENAGKHVIIFDKFARRLIAPCFPPTNDFLTFYMTRPSQCLWSMFNLVTLVTHMYKVVENDTCVLVIG